jgi:DNA modification methylase
MFGSSAEQMPLEDASIDLIVTSPPYASNAIDYMRAHKFSLVWLGHRISDLSKKRKEYIGGEAVGQAIFEPLPTKANSIVREIEEKDQQKARVLHLYYSEMHRVLQEMFRVLKNDRSAIVVVGSSLMRGIDTQTQNCLAAIGETIGFEVPMIAERNLDRNRRMLPAGMEIDKRSQIQQRMHTEYVIGFYKP